MPELNVKGVQMKAGRIRETLRKSLGLYIRTDLGSGRLLQPNLFALQCARVFPQIPYHRSLFFSFSVRHRLDLPNQDS